MQNWIDHACTQAVRSDWGSVADWISGVGSLGAVVAALVLAQTEHSRAKRLEAKERERRDSLYVEAHVALEAGLGACAQLLTHMQDDRPEDFGEHFDAWNGEMAASARAAQALMRVASSEPALVVLLAEALNILTGESNAVSYAAVKTRVEGKAKVLGAVVAEISKSLG